jgi:hypothetical protein
MSFHEFEHGLNAGHSQRGFAMTMKNLRGAKTFKFMAHCLTFIACLSLGASTAFAQEQPKLDPKDSTSIFDSLQIKKKSKSATLKGRAAIRAVIGKPIAFAATGGGTILYIFDDERHFRLRQTAPDDGEIAGIVEDSAYGRDSKPSKKTVCFDFKGIAQNHCDEVQLKGDNFSLISNGETNKGKVLFDQEPPSPKPAESVAGHPMFCKPLRAIVRTGIKNIDFDSLIDQTKDPLPTDAPGEEPIRQSTLKLGTCVIRPAVTSPKVACVMPDKLNAKASEELYQTTVMQVYLCLKKEIQVPRVDTSVGAAAHGVRVAGSTFFFANDLRLDVRLGVSDVCFTMPEIADCEEKYGVLVNAWFDP